MVQIEVDGLRKVFGTALGNEVVAVDGVSFDIEDDEILSLVGPSGCGKTTTLRCVAGLEDPTSGTIYFDGQDVSNQPPQERNVAMLFQDIALWHHMTVRENMAFSLRIRGYDRETIKQRIQEAASDLQIQDKLDQKPAQLSGGQRQRVALGRAIVQDPDLFLFDEPLSALDAALKREIQPLIKQIVKEAGVPAIYVTHDQQEAMNLSDKIAVMNNGEIEQFASPLEIYRDPENSFVGEFIGNPRMNLIQAEAGRQNGESVIKLDGMEFQTTENTGGANSLQVGVRPQHVVVEDETHSTGIQAAHIVDEPQGDETHSHFETPHGEIIAITPPDFRGEGNEYRLTFVEDEVHLFTDDKDTAVDATA